MTIKKILLFCTLSVCCATMWADEDKVSDTFTVEVYYRQGSYRLDPAYMDNQNRLDSLLRFFRVLSSDSIFRINHFSIVSTASPEGSFLFNKVLSEKRANNIRNYLVERLSAEQALMITDKKLGIDWDNLRDKVERSNMPHKDEVLLILKNTPEWVVKDGVVVDSRKKRLMDLFGGSCWRYMEKHFFPELRRSFVEVQCSVVNRFPEQRTLPETDTLENCPQIVPVPMGEPDSEDSVMVLTVQPQPITPFYMAVKTNLLYDIMMVPNAGVEFYFGKGFSVGANWMYAWWKNNVRHRYWRLYGGELAIRKYIGRPDGGSPLTGHHLGIYGQIFTYDFEVGGRGYMGGKPGGTLWEKMSYVAGVEYGYSLPILRRLNFDFVIGLGYWGGTYYEYLPGDNHYVWQQTKQRHWFGPTKAEVSLVWLLGRGNYNMKKGGKQ